MIIGRINSYVYWCINFINMGCKCNKRKVIEKLAKYSDNPKDKTLKLSFFKKILQFIGSIIMKIIMAILFIVILIPLSLYVLFCLIIGKQPVIHLKKIARFINKEAAERIGKENISVKPKRHITIPKEKQNRNNSWWTDKGNNVKK